MALEGSLMGARKLKILALSASLAAVGLWASQARRVELTAACGTGCAPSPVPFVVPSGCVAERFAILRMIPGRACAGERAERLSGFSIRRGREVAFVYYPGPRGVVSDPVPLEDLSLGPGAYALLAAPAEGASVTLEFQVAAHP